MINYILHHVGMSWIISSNNEMKHEIDESNHQYWLNKRTCYNTVICSRLHGSIFEYFITHARTHRYNLMCSLITHNKKLPSYEDDGISIRDSIMPKNVTTEELEALGTTLNFIYIWLKLFDDNYDAIRVAYITAMKDMFKQTPQTMIKEFTPKQIPENYDRYWCWMVY